MSSQDTHKEILARASRTAMNIGGVAPDVLTLVTTCEELLVNTVTSHPGYPPIASLSNVLLSRFKKSDLTLNIRQLVGVAVSAIMLKNGYVQDNSGIRITRGALFTSGSTYRRALQPENLTTDPVLDMLYRMVSSLSADEIVKLRQIISLVELRRMEASQV